MTIIKRYPASYLPHVNHWLEEIAIQFRGRATGMQVTNGYLRSPYDECPLCTLSRLKRNTEVDYHGAWLTAVRAAYGEIGVINHRALQAIAAAADNTRYNVLGYHLIAACNGAYIPTTLSDYY